MLHPGSEIWTIGDSSVREAEAQPRDDMKIRGVHSHSPGNGSLGRIHLQGVIASDVGDAVRLEDLRGVKFHCYDANLANLNNFILNWEGT